jgi:MFS family permease
MAIAVAVTAANLYYCQPLLSQITRSLHMTAHETADIPMLAQIGYALGLPFFAQLGDMVERRGLATALLLIVTQALVGTASAADRWVLPATSLITGIFSVVPQVMAPMASALSKTEAQGGGRWESCWAACSSEFCVRARWLASWAPGSAGARCMPLPR